jgi:putative membrane protein
MTPAWAKIRLRKVRAGWVIGVVSLLVVLVVALLLLTPNQVFQQSIWLSQIEVAWLPHFNAVLNATSAVLLVAAYIFIRHRQIKRHRFCMLFAFSLSTLFLVSYVVYHAVAGSTPFTGSGWIRPVYFAILISHIILAILVIPLVLTTLHRAWRGLFIPHRRLARWTLPAWLYVSISGVVVYLMLYYWN